MSSDAALIVLLDATIYTNGTFDIKASDHNALLADIINSKVNNDQKGVANGVAPLDGANLVPVSHIPPQFQNGDYEGVWDADTNTPTLTDAAGPNNGDWFKVSTADPNGWIDIDLGSGTIRVYNGGTITFNGSINQWQPVGYGDAVASVFGRIGVVTAQAGDYNTDQVTEGATNLYYTEGRFSASFALKTTDDLTEGATNKYYSDLLFATSFALRTTDNLAEGAANLYWTNGRFDAAFAAKDTDALAEGAVNFYWTQSRFDTAFTAKSTSDLSEGTNLYYTQGRFDTAFGAKSTDDLSEGALNFYWTQGRFDTAFAAKTTDNLPEGATNEYWKEAPQDGEEYVRKNGAWAVASAGGEVTEYFAKSNNATQTINGNVEVDFQSSDIANSAIVNVSGDTFTLEKDTGTYTIEYSLAGRGNTVAFGVERSGEAWIERSDGGPYSRVEKSTGQQNWNTGSSSTSRNRITCSGKLVIDDQDGGVTTIRVMANDPDGTDWVLDSGRSSINIRWTGEDAGGFPPPPPGGGGV